uniref:Extracellular calcium-sensing receptor-like n=1 Tax=Erpetoichthys calabaricus TaxID=27687 RepID=A0A8C4TIB5_ERPCA
MFYFTIFALSDFEVVKSTCRMMENFELNGLYKDGDIMLGGIFAVNFKTSMPDQSFRAKPEKWNCTSFDFSGFQLTQTMIFAIEEINRDQSLLPNITLGYKIYDNCVKLPVALRAAVSLISGHNSISTGYGCTGPPPVLAVIGDPGSTHSIVISRILSLFQMPLVSYYATCSCLSNKQEYPTFFRTIPSDTFQVKAVIQIIKHYGWTWVGAIASDDDYGQNAVKTFHEEFSNFGCISFLETIPKINEKDKVLQIVNTIKQSTAKVIIVFSSEADITSLVREVVLQNITGRQWIASEAWSTSPVLASMENFNSFGGTIGIAIRRGNIKGLENFLLQLKPKYESNNNLLIQFWESLFGCKFSFNSTSVPVKKACTGLEDIRSMKTAFNDVSELRASYNVYKAVHALAEALNNLMTCEKGEGPNKIHKQQYVSIFQHFLYYLEVLHYLKEINFTNHLGERVAFDKNGDAIAIYDIMNWQLKDNETVFIKTVGVFDESAGPGNELLLLEDTIFWNFESKTIPTSVCSIKCPPGKRKALRKGEPICCYDCVLCADGEISNQTDSSECIKCLPDYWSNSDRNQCVMKEVEFLSYEDVMGIILTTIALIGASLSVGVLGIFIHHRNTPVVKANNAELSFLLLVSLTFCFLCSLCFIGKPSDLTCMLRHVIFGISFSFSVSCILVKTIVVIMAFKATLPGNNIMKWFGVAQQRSTVILFTFIQSVVCTVWLTISPSVPIKNMNHQNSKVILECAIGSMTGFSFLLGYIFLLSVVCFLLAFLARNLPDTFNEARFITFSMLIFCAVWVAFIPAYVSTPGKYTVAVEVFAIITSSFGILFSIFTPKCYIILLKPDKNTKKSLLEWKKDIK